MRAPDTASEAKPAQQFGKTRERHEDHSFDLVARVRAAKEAAQREIEAFGDISEYEVRIIQGQKKESPEPSESGKESTQPTFAFDAETNTATEES